MPERTPAFGRREAVRALLLAILLVGGLGTGVALDLAPANPGLATGVVAPETIRAPRDASIPNLIETQAAREAASMAVDPRYDYTPDGAAAIASVQVAELQLELQPVDQAMSAVQAPEARREALASALPFLSSTARAVLMSLDPSRWPTVEDAAVGALRSGEQTEIRDTDLATKQATLAQSYIPTTLDLTTAERSLAAAIATPYYVANSTYSPTLTDQARAAAAAATPVQTDEVKAGQVLVDQGHVITASDMIRISYFELQKSKVDLGPAAGWLVFSLGRNPPGLDVALPAGVLAPQPDLLPDRADLRPGRPGHEDPGRSDLGPIRDAHGGGRNAHHAPA
jgi:membrane-associated HD superfamily phosphohydrolase